MPKNQRKLIDDARVYGRGRSGLRFASGAGFDAPQVTLPEALLCGKSPQHNRHPHAHKNSDYAQQHDHEGKREAPRIPGHQQADHGDEDRIRREVVGSHAVVVRTPDVQSLSR